MPIVRRTRLFKSACGVLLVVLVVVVWSWDVSDVHSVYTAYVPTPHDHSQHKQEITTCSFKQSGSPDDGHNDARNMLRVLITNKHQITVTSSWFYYLPTLKMHGHMNVK